MSDGERSASGASGGDGSTSDGDWHSEGSRGRSRSRGRRKKRRGGKNSRSRSRSRSKSRGRKKGRKGRRRGRRGRKRRSKTPSYLRGTASGGRARGGKGDTDAKDGKDKPPPPPPKDKPDPPKYIDLPLPGTVRVTQGVAIIECSQDLSVLDPPATVSTGSRLRVSGSDAICTVDAVDGVMITLERGFPGPDGETEQMSKVILESEDTRPAWEREYVANRVPFSPHEGPRWSTSSRMARSATSA